MAIMVYSEEETFRLAIAYLSDFHFKVIEVLQLTVGSLFVGVLALGASLGCDYR